MIDLAFTDDVFVLRMCAGENRFEPEFVRAFDAALDEVEASKGAAALVVTGEGKFFSNGLDLEWVQAATGEQLSLFASSLEALFARLLAFPLATVAAQNGHAFAAGAVFALVHDFRVMRSDRGYFCLPEVDLGIPFSAGSLAIVKARLAAPTLHDAVLSGRRFTAEEALEKNIVAEIAVDEEVVPRATLRAAALAGKDRPTLAALKRALYADAIAKLEAAASRAG